MTLEERYEKYQKGVKQSEMIKRDFAEYSKSLTKYKGIKTPPPEQKKLSRHTRAKTPLGAPVSASLPD